jgi:hypothetical protein
VGIVAALGVTMTTAYATASVLAQGAGVQATIVLGASTLMGAAGAKAFSPNPINVKARVDVVATKTSIKNKVYAILVRYDYSCPTNDVSSQKAMQWQ